MFPGFAVSLLPPMKIQANGIEIEVLVQGPADGEPLLLIMGLGMQLIAWPEEMIAELAARGFRVIRFDNRDVGLSTHMDHLGVPNLWLATMQYSMHMPVLAPYRLTDMAADTLGVLDALGIGKVHVCGASMGGMIAQHLASRHPERVASLALMMTSSGSRLLPKPQWHVRQALMPPPRGLPIEAKVEHLERSMYVIGSPAYRPDPLRQRVRLEAFVRRSWRPAGALRQMLAVAADGDRSPLLRKLDVPAVVIHGDADPLVPPAAATDLVRKLRGARLDLIPGMGHDLPLQLVERVVDDIGSNAQRARVALS